jgi:hypothetical protein
MRRDLVRSLARFAMVGASDLRIFDRSSQTVKITVETRAHGRRRIECFRKFRYFAITSPVAERGEEPERDWYNVTHIHSGCLAGVGFRSKHHAELLAAILDRLPIKWDKVSKRSVLRKRERKSFIAMWRSLPMEIQIWRFNYQGEFGRNNLK